MDNQQVLYEALALHQGVLRYVDCYSVGRNNGGIYVKLFSSKAIYVICTVYENDFKKLPRDIADKAMQVGSKLEAQEEAVSNRETAKKKSLLQTIPLMLITRFQYEPGADKEKWRFYGVYKTFGSSNTSNGTPVPPTEAPSETKSTNGSGSDEIKFSSVDEAYNWAVDKGAFQSTDQARVAFIGLYKRTGFEKEPLHQAWINTINELISGREKKKARSN